MVFHAREEHLRVPRQHRENVDCELLGLRSFISNTRRRAAKLSPKRRDALTALGMPRYRCRRRPEEPTGQRMLSDRQTLGSRAKFWLDHVAPLPRPGLHNLAQSMNHPVFNRNVL